MKKFNKHSNIVIIVVCCIIVALILWWVIKQEAPHHDGVWSNEDGSFILDTDTSVATIATDNVSESIFVAYTPGTHFTMYYPVPEGTAGVYAKDYIHTGEIYRIFDSIHIKCDDGCFDVRLKKTE
ncbi:MAG: hypothetical protein E7485_06005 [Ruminococcaceae bacterium]|nr:hypothetical protein [Oscillospiraceae bacterium]